MDGLSWELTACRYNFEKTFGQFLRAWFQPIQIPSPEDLVWSEKHEEMLRQSRNAWRDFAAGPENERAMREQFDALFNHMNVEDDMRPNLDDFFEL
jgi:hypothetical protein